MFYLRASAAIAMFAVASLYAIFLAVVRRDRSRVALDYARMIERLVQPALGLSVEVLGAENLVRKRPCIYVANHQSSVDVPLLAGIFQPETVLVAKRELRSMPLFGWIYDRTGNIFIDRSNSASAVQQLQEAERTIREKGVSVWMFPEGTRGRVPGVLLPFKKGAFHLATAAGVPLVPIVVGPVTPFFDAKRRRLNPGRIRIRVLEPVETAGSAEADVPGIIQEVHERMSRALEELGAEQRLERGSASSS